MIALSSEPGRRGGRKLLVVTPYLPPFGGGLERYAVAMAMSLASRHDWRLAFVSSGSGVRRVQVQRHQTGAVYLLPTAFTCWNTPFHPAWPRQIARIIAAERPDIVCAHAPVPGIAECAAYAAKGIPFVLAYHMASLRKGRFPADQLAFGYEHIVLRWLARRAAHVISSSDYVNSFHQAKFGGKGSVVEPGVDTGRFWGLAGPRPAQILFVAALGPGTTHKGLHDLLEAMATVVTRHRDARLVVVGDGAARPRYERAAAALGLADHVSFVGHLEGEDLARAYRSARILAVPSHADNLPLVVLEAMASRVAVVATRVGSLPDLLDGGSRGILVAPKDVAGLAAGLSRLLADSALAERFGAAGRELAEAAFDWSVQSDRTDEILQRVLTGARGEDKRRRYRRDDG